MITHTERFEAINSLYYSRTGYLRPGKDALYYDSSSEENSERFTNWLATTGFTDAINRIVELEREIEALDTSEDI